MADATRSASTAPQNSEYFAERLEMVERQIRDRGVHDPRVLDAMLAVPRHAFVPPEQLIAAYNDQALPIGQGQTISQPFIVGSMTAALHLVGSERVLELGTGSGYQTALLSLLAREVHTIENHAELSQAAGRRLAQLGYHDIFFHVGDGTLGVPDAAPFDAIIVTAAAPMIPPPLVTQLAEGGRILLPLGDAETQEMVRAHKHNGQLVTERLYDCRFVPLIGRYGWSEGAAGAPGVRANPVNE